MELSEIKRPEEELLVNMTCSLRRSEYEHNPCRAMLADRLVKYGANRLGWVFGLHVDVHDLTGLHEIWAGGSGIHLLILSSAYEWIPWGCLCCPDGVRRERLRGMELRTMTGYDLEYVWVKF